MKGPKTYVGGVFGEGGPRGEAEADDEGLDGAIPTRSGFGDVDVGEDAAELRLEERGVVAARVLANTSTTDKRRIRGGRRRLELISS